MTEQDIPSISIVNLDEGHVVLENGEIIKITQWCDVDGECYDTMDNVDHIVSVVAVPTSLGLWFAIEIEYAGAIH